MQGAHTLLADPSARAIWHPCSSYKLVCFAYAAPEVSVEDANFWHGGAFRLRRGADESVICPRFLDPLVGGILSAGKSMLLLRMKQPQTNR